MLSMKIEPEITPDRLYELLLCISQGYGKIDEINSLLAPSLIDSRAINKLIQLSIDLGFIKNDEVSLAYFMIDENIFENFNNALAVKATEDQEYFYTLQNLLANQELLYGTSLDRMWDQLKSKGIVNCSSQYFKGFRFWMEYLGYSINTGNGIIIAPFERILRVYEELSFSPGINISIFNFLDQICNTAQEFDVFIDNKKMDSVLMESLMYLEDIGLIKTKYVKDSPDFMESEEKGLSKRITDIVIRRDRRD